MTIARFVDRFTDDSISTIVKFPLVDYEWETSQGLRTPFAEVSGAHYGLDLLGSSVGLKTTASERIRFSVFSRCGMSGIDEIVQDMRANLFKIGKGKLWQRGPDHSRRWASARIVSFPEYTIAFGPDRAKILPVTLEFRRDSDWRSKSIIGGSQAASGTVTITNPGNARVYDAILYLSGTYTNPIITNNTNGYSFQTIRDGSSVNHILKIDAGAHTIEFASDGSTFLDDHEFFQRPPTQVQLMVLEPGDNEFTFTGISSATFAWEFYGAWH